MHHTISDSSIQPTQSTSKSAPKFLPESQDENVCQPLCISSWNPQVDHQNIHQVDHMNIPLSPEISTARHTSIGLKSLKTQSDKITSKGKLNPLQESRGEESSSDPSIIEKLTIHQDRAKSRTRERDQTHSYWYIPSAPRVNYSLLVMESVGMMKMAIGEGFPFR